MEQSKSSDQHVPLQCKPIDAERDRLCVRSCFSLRHWFSRISGTPDVVALDLCAQIIAYDGAEDLNQSHGVVGGRFGQALKVTSRSAELHSYGMKVMETAANEAAVMYGLAGECSEEVQSLKRAQSSLHKSGDRDVNGPLS